MKNKAIRITLIMLIIAMALTIPAFAKKKKKTVFKPQFVETSLTLYGGDSYTLKLKKTAPKTPRYSTANKKVVTVGSKSKTGVKLTAKNVKKKTKVKITAKVGSKKATCTVTVLPASQKPKTGGTTTNTSTNNNYNNNNPSTQETGSVSNNNNSSSGGTTTTPAQPKPTYTEKYTLTEVPSSTSMTYIAKTSKCIGRAGRSYTYGEQGGKLVANASDIKVTSSSPYVRVYTASDSAGGQDCLIYAAPQNIECGFPKELEGKFPSASLPLTATITIKYKDVTKTTSVTVTDYANPTDKQLFNDWESMMKQETQVTNSNVSPIAKVVNTVKFSAKHYYYANPTPAGYPGTYQYKEWNCFFCFKQDYLNKINTLHNTSFALRQTGLSCWTSTDLITYIIKNYTSGLTVQEMDNGNGHVWCEVYLPDGRFINCDAGMFGGNPQTQRLPRACDALLYSANGDPLCSWGGGEGANWNFTYETPSEMEAYIQAHPYN